MVELPARPYDKREGKAVREVVLGKSGLTVSAVGFGGIPIQRLDDEEAVAVVRRALDLGVTFIDTASSYSDSQRKIGRAIEGRREGLVLATKTHAGSRREALKHIERSRRELGVDTIDLYQLHNVASPKRWAEVSGRDGSLRGLIEARDRGHVAHIGFTSHSVDMALELLDEPVFETAQVPFNLVTSEPAEELIPKARANDVGFIVMKPLCGGQFDDAGLAFRFLNSYPDLVPIPGIETVEEIEEIVEIVESGQTLQGEEEERANAIVAKLGKVFCRRCGYCMPCPQGVPVTQMMIFDSMVKRLPQNRVERELAPHVIERAALCVECGECEDKCPYDLPITETIKETAEKARVLAR
jgi:predicted aldo/keto reductase-like oxidoreductase